MIMMKSLFEFLSHHRTALRTQQHRWQRVLREVAAGQLDRSAAFAAFVGLRPTGHSFHKALGYSFDNIKWFHPYVSPVLFPLSSQSVLFMGLLRHFPQNTAVKFGKPSEGVPETLVVLGIPQN